MNATLLCPWAAGPLNDGRGVLSGRLVPPKVPDLGHEKDQQRQEDDEGASARQHRRGAEGDRERPGDRGPNGH